MSAIGHFLIQITFSTVSLHVAAKYGSTLQRFIISLLHGELLSVDSRDISVALGT